MLYYTIAPLSYCKVVPPIRLDVFLCKWAASKRVECYYLNLPCLGCLCRHQLLFSGLLHSTDNGSVISCCFLAYLFFLVSVSFSTVVGSLLLGYTKLYYYCHNNNNGSLNFLLSLDQKVNKVSLHFTATTQYESAYTSISISK